MVTRYLWEGGGTEGQVESRRHRRAGTIEKRGSQVRDGERWRS